MSEWFFKEGDRGVDITGDLLDETGSPKDVTGASVRFHMREVVAVGVATPPAKVDQPATIVTAPQGAVKYTLQVGDLDDPGYYYAEWEVTFPSGAKQTFPNADYDRILITPQLA